MPEGHTVRRLANRFVAEMGGQSLEASSPQGRFADGAALIDGQVLVRTDAHGKQMFADFGGGRWLRVHLGLYGKWTFGAGTPPEPRGALRLRLVGDATFADLRGPTACEVITATEKSAIHARLGADPLRRTADIDALVARVTRSRAPIATILMDQSVIAGIGNVYRAEALFRAGMSPDREGRSLTTQDVLDLWADLRLLLRDGVRRGRIVTTHPADRPAGRVTSQSSHYVYRRQGLPCRRCGTAVAVRQHVGRNLFWCRRCQR